MVTFEQLKMLEKYLDQAWKMLGIDVSFTKHFLERANDPRNGKPIDIRELQKLFVEAYKRYGAMFSRMKLGDNEIEGVLTDLSTKINSPFVLSWDKRTREFDLRAKTVMRKNNFVPNNPRERKYTVEDRYSNSHQWSDYDRAHGPTWTDWIAKKLGTHKWVIAPYLTDKHKEKGYKVAISQARYLELNKQFKELNEERTTQMTINRRFNVSDDFVSAFNEIKEQTRQELVEKQKALEEASRRAKQEMLGEGQIDEVQYSKSSVDSAIASSNRFGRKIKKGESKLIHALLKGHQKSNEPTPVKKPVRSEEVEQIDELSKGTLGSYIKKASHDVATKSAATGRYGERSNVAQDKYKKGDYSVWQQGKKDDATADKFFKKSWKRREGIAKAVDKLSKEDLDESSKEERLAQIRKELEDNKKKKPTWKQKWKTFKRQAHNAVNPNIAPKHLRDDIEQVDEDCLKINVPLMIRLLEYAREDAKDDVALHKAVEKMMKISEGGKELQMADYKAIMEEHNLQELSKKSLQNYIDRAKEDRDEIQPFVKKSPWKRTQDKADRNIANRNKGIDLATKKLNK